MADMKRNKNFLAGAMALCLIAAPGCAAEIDVFELPGQDVSPLIGSWEWRPDVSHIEVDPQLRAIQTSDFDSPEAAPSSYTMIPSGEGVLVLEGWLAHAPCEADVSCDEGRAYQRSHMSYHVDDEHFFPFALLRKSGKPGTVGGQGAGEFEGFGVEETRLKELAPSGDAVFRATEVRWRLSLEPDGGWSSITQATDLDGDGIPYEKGAEHGSWTLDAAGNLTMHHAESGETTHTVWKGDVIALDGLIFTRTP